MTGKSMPEAHDNVRVLGIIRRCIHAVVNTVNHDREIDGLCRLGLERCGRRRGPRCKVGIGRIVTKDAVLGIVPPISVQRKMHVALIAVRFGHHGAARGHC